MSRDRVVLVTSEFPSRSQTFVALKYILLRKRGWDVWIATEDEKDGWALYPELDATGARERIVSGPFGELLMESVDRLSPGLVHFEFGHHARRCLTEHALPGCAVLVSFQGYDICIDGLDAEPGYYRCVWDRAGAVHFDSEDLRERALARGMPESMETEVIHPLVDLDMFEPGPRKYGEPVGNAARPLRILSVGRLHWKKGVQFGLRAVRKLEERGVVCDMRIGGEGEAERALAIEAERLGVEDSVSMIGPLTLAEVKDQYRWADVVVLPSVSEGFNCVALEAQAMGVPVVASDAEGLPQNVADGVSGFIVPRRDVGALADRLEALARSAELRERMGRGGYGRARSEFALEDRLRGFEELYRRLLARPS